METNILNIVAIAGVLTLASLVQSAIGFAYALVATPLLIWIGVPLPNAITVVATCSLVQSIIGARHLRAAVPWRLALIATLVRMSMLVVGLLVLRQMAGLDTRTVRFVVGVVLCILVLTQLVAKARPTGNMHWAWGGLAFSTSGLLAGMCGMGGPPLVLWSVRHDWPVERNRGFLFTVFAVSIPIQIVLLYLAFGADILTSVVTALLFMPAVLLGACVGLPLGNRLPRAVLSEIVYITLLLIGLSSIIPVAVDKLR